jgi:hypothetical protein
LADPMVEPRKRLIPILKAAARYNSIATRLIPRVFMSA